jgi:hypothetical protein
MRNRRAQLGRFAFSALAAVLASLLLLAGCGGGGGTPSPPPPRLPSPLTITTAALPEGSLGQTYGLNLEATGGTWPYAWSLASGSGPLPPGLSLEKTGLIAGVPVSNGTYSFNVAVRDAGGATSTRVLTMTVREPLVMLAAQAPGGVKDRPYSFKFEATGGLQPYVWTAYPDGALPPGLSLDRDGLLSGMPTSIGYYGYARVRVDDNSGRRAEAPISIVITTPLRVSTSSLNDTNVGRWYTAPVLPEGGLPPYHSSLAPGSAPLPPGLSIVSPGWPDRIEGVPTQPGEYSFVVQITDSVVPPQVATRELSLFVDNKLYFPGDSSLPLGVEGRAYHATLHAYGGTLPYSWRVVSGQLPSGLDLYSSTGEISGVSLEARTVTLTVEVRDSSDPTQIQTGSVYLPINPPVDFPQQNLPYGIQGTSYYGGIGVRYGLPPYSLRLVAGTLPPGLTLETGPSYAGFTFSGAPTTVGQYSFSVEASDSASPPTTASQNLSIRVVPVLKISTTSLPGGWTRDPYTATLSGTGGIPPYYWDDAYPLPRGLTLDQLSGVISGTPWEAFNQDVFVAMRDNADPWQGTSKNLPLRIIGRLLIATSRLPAARPNLPYRVRLGLEGGTPPYTWVLSSGSVPAGLSFNPATHEITGTPTTEGTSSFTVKVTDTGPPVQTASRALSLTIKRDLGRNDTIATATPISNGTFRASISPFSVPVSGPADPDNDYYVLTASPTAVVTVEIRADRLAPPSSLDSVIEIVDAAGNRFNTCHSWLGAAVKFNRPCLNDDFSPSTTLDSRLYFQVPGTDTTPVTFYVHAFDWSGNARPDFVYDLIVTGAN